MQDFDLFLEASKEMDALIDEGFLGNDTKELNAKRDTTETSQYLYECFVNIFDQPKNTYGVKNTIGITGTLLGLFHDGIVIDSQEIVDILAAVFKGTRDTPELESLSSYNEYLYFFTEYKTTVKSLSAKQCVTNIDKKKLTSSLLTAYSKGVEFIGKSFTFLLAILQVKSGQSYNLLDNSKLTTYCKLEKFKKLSSGKYDKLTTMINRDIRNADSHLNAMFSTSQNAYIMKKTVKGKGGKLRIETFKITWDDMVTKVSPQIGWFIQGFVSACILVYLAFGDIVLYKKATSIIHEINSDPSIL